MENSIVEIKNVWFAYNGQTVLEDVSLDIRPGDFIAMIGPNGGGKTTSHQPQLSHHCHRCCADGQAGAE
jgi:ABC-type Mn2+/Zn2+ transport system ATPase subunit